MNKELHERHKEALQEIQQKLSIKPKKEEPEKPKNKTPKARLFIFKPNIRADIIGILILLYGIELILYPYILETSNIIDIVLANLDRLQTKIGMGFVLIGVFFIFLIHEKSPSTEPKQKPAKPPKLLMSEKISLVLSLWILILFVITYTTTLEVFFILVFIGTLVTKELTDYYTTPNLKKRLNVFIVIFLIIFIVIISQKIINIL